MEQVVFGTYRHYKGKTYRVLALAEHTETGEQLVIYQALYDEGKIWARPLKMFEETITVGGKDVKRFEYIGE